MLKWVPVFNWFLRLIGIPSIISEVYARMDRQVETLRIENDLLNGHIERHYNETSIVVNGLRDQLSTLLEHVTKPREPADAGLDQEMIGIMLAAIDQDLRRIHNRVDLLEGSSITKDVTDDRLIQEIDENSVRISTIAEQLNKLHSKLTQSTGTQ